MKIIIIDSGVNPKHECFADSDIQCFKFENDMLVSDETATFGHGTAVASIIKKSGAQIISIKLMENDDGIEEEKLISLLNYIYINIDCKIINMSLGLQICNNYYGLKKICDKLNDRGTILISAFDNTGSISYPAAFDSVIGVTTGKNCVKTKDFIYLDDDIVNIAAKGNTQRVAWTNPSYLMINGNSFACAHVTRQAAIFMKNENKTRLEILEKFKEMAIATYHKKNNNVKTKVFDINKAVLFPFNKEMHSLIRYINNLSFEIVDVYDTKYSSRIGATTTHLLKDDKVKNLIIKNIENIEWNSFDTLILGHTEELLNLMDKNNLKSMIINKAIENNKKIYSFDDLSKLSYDCSETIYYPKITNENLPPNRFGMLYRISRPVVGIFGTSSCQGKFTLQLKMREILLKHGYNVGQIGTEPSSELYGMDYSFPIGYNSSVHIKEFDTIRYLNNAINSLCLEQKDIIIVGCQSGTLQYDTGNISLFNIPQYNFLLGTQPDCVILCVNPYDDFNYIKKTIDFLQSCTNSKVIALVIFPMDIKDDWSGVYGAKIPLPNEKYNRLKKELNCIFNLPIYKLGCELDMDELVELTTDFFT